MPRLAVFASGGGSNLGALLDAAAAGRFDGASVALVVSDRDGCRALDRARIAGIATAVVPPADHPTADAFGAALLQVLEAHGVDVVLLAGYLKQVPPAVVRAFDGRMLNIHPSLLPAHGGPGMYGRRVHEAVLAAGAAESGCTVHLVSEQYDDGPILAQVRVPVCDGDTADTLAARVLEAEHALYPAVVATFLREQLEA